MAIDINHPQCPGREQRLKSITGYEGTASDLCRKSREGTLANRERSFTQCIQCPSYIAHYQLAMIQDAAVVNHAPLGCAGDYSDYNFNNRTGQYSRGWKIANIHLISSNLRESEIVFGGAAKLREAIQEAYHRFQPKAIFVTTSCASAIIGEDIQGVLEEFEAELGIPVVPIYCEGFRSSIWATGADAVYHGILHKIVKPAKVRRRDLINVITINGDDAFTKLLGKIGLVPNYVIPFTTIDQLERLSEAAATIQVCPTMGTYLAAGLEQHFGVPEVKAPPPYGIAGTDAWLRELGRTVGKEKEVEELITAEKSEIAAPLAELRGKLSGLKSFVSAGGVHGHSLISVLKELGIEVLGGCIGHHNAQPDHGEYQADSLAHIVTHYGDVKLNICNKQSFELVNRLNRLKPDIFIVRHSGMAIWGAKLGIPTLQMGDDYFSLGYQGLLNYGQEILHIISNPAYVKNLARHTKLPYTAWWLKQEPFSFLGGRQHE